ncbi:MAG: family 16 glycosylhydrolase [Haloarculaceae archaeon]
MNRRTYLKLAGGGAAVAGGVWYATDRLQGDGDHSEQSGHPPPGGNWRLRFEDQFREGSLDSDAWDVGWGWGTRTSKSPTRAVAENVELRDDQLRLSGTHDGDAIRAGVVNTRNKVTFGPGSYLEARVVFAERQGFLNAFWAKPNSEAWPPEIDVVEVWQDGSGWDDTHRTHHHLHYAESTRTGDASTHRNVGATVDYPTPVTDRFHVYGVEWRRDRVVHYVDGRPIKVWLEPTMTRAMEHGAPFYLMFSLNVDKIGRAPRDEPWGEAMIVDWVRLWDRVA